MPQWRRRGLSGERRASSPPELRPSAPSVHPAEAAKPFASGTTPTVDGGPRTSEPPAAKGLIEIDDFAAHWRAPISKSGFVWKA